MVNSAESSVSPNFPHFSSQNAPSIPPQLKFLMSNIKNILQTPLAVDNHPIWKAQVLKLFNANGFGTYLDSNIPPPPLLLTQEDGTEEKNPEYDLWLLIDQNLSSAIFSTVSPQLLPYILNLNTTAEIWATLERRLQSSNRARLMQLRNELHSITMGSQSMTQYLSQIKSKVDLIAASGSPLDSEDILHYTLNGLPSNYSAFKTAIRTSLQPIGLDDLYSLLCSEEMAQANEAANQFRYLHTPITRQ